MALPLAIIQHPLGGLTRDEVQARAQSAGGAGKHSCFSPTFGNTRAITRPLALKDGTAVTSIEALRQA